MVSLYPRAGEFTTRGHGFILRGVKFKDMKSFSQRVNWNELPAEVAEVIYLQCFKGIYLDRYLDSKGYA